MADNTTNPMLNKIELKIVIDTPAWSFVKYKDDGSVDYISPIPCPFNYGSLPDTKSPDGDRIDALLLGERLERGTEIKSLARGQVKFYDAGVEDHKYILSDKEISNSEKLLIKSFFILFALLKKVFNKLKHKVGRTYLGQIIYF